MRMHWTAFGVGAIIGAVAGYLMSKGMGANVANITGNFARPYVAGFDSGKR
jgi:uncharacterized protein YcfJ